MNRTSLAFAALFGLTFTGAVAHAEPVMHGAMDICQVIDDGITTQSNGTEVCCAAEKTEYDDGMVIYGQQYCVACAANSDNCVRQDVARNTQQTIQELKKSLAVKPRQAPVTMN